MNEYVTLDAFKTTLNITNTAQDADAQLALDAAAAGIEAVCSRRFYLEDVSNDETRVYTPDRPLTCVTDDIAALTSLQLDYDGDGVYEVEWTEGVEFFLYPLNADRYGRPWKRIKVRNQGSYRLLPYGCVASVKVTGRFGWAVTPPAIVQATTILASRLMKRAREAPFAVLLAPDSVAHIARTDPDVAFLISDYIDDERVG